MEDAKFNFCQACGKATGPEEKFCPACGSSVLGKNVTPAHPPMRRRRTGLEKVIVGLLLCVIGAVGAYVINEFSRSITGIGDFGLGRAVHEDLNSGKAEESASNASNVPVPTPSIDPEWTIQHDAEKLKMSECLRKFPRPHEDIELRIDKIIREYVASCGQDYVKVWRKGGYLTEEQSIGLAVVDAYKAMGCRYRDSSQADFELTPQGYRVIVCDVPGESGMASTAVQPASAPSP
jgi:hypothetical protein